MLVRPHTNGLQYASDGRMRGLFKDPPAPARAQDIAADDSGGYGALRAGLHSKGIGFRDESSPQQTFAGKVIVGSFRHA